MSFNWMTRSEKECLNYSFVLIVFAERKEKRKESKLANRILTLDESWDVIIVDINDDKCSAIVFYHDCRVHLHTFFGFLREISVVVVHMSNNIYLDVILCFRLSMLLILVPIVWWNGWKVLEKVLSLQLVRKEEFH